MFNRCAEDLELVPLAFRFGMSGGHQSERRADRGACVQDGHRGTEATCAKRDTEKCLTRVFPMTAARCRAADPLELFLFLFLKMFFFLLVTERSKVKHFKSAQQFFFE